MNSMQRMLLALSHKEADRVPVYPIVSGASRRLLGVDYKTWSTDSKVCSKALITAAEELELDCIVTLIDLSVECDAWGQKIIFPENEAAHPDFSNHLIKDIDDYKKVKKVDWKASERMKMHVDVCRRLVEQKGGELPIVAFVFGPLGVLSMLRGQQDMYMDIYDDPDAVFEATKQVNETLKDYVSAIIDTGVNAVMFDTLFASGSIMSKKMWMDMEGVLVKELADVVHSRNVPVMIHNCGKDIYFDIQIETMRPSAISFLYPPDDCSDFRECKEKYGKDITLIGCVPPPMVVMATDEEWDEACRKSIDEMAAGGGFILATGCEFPANADLSRAKRMVETAKTYGRYDK